MGYNKFILSIKNKQFTLYNNFNYLKSCVYNEISMSLSAHQL